MVKSQNKELSRAEYACRTMRNVIKEKDEEIENLKQDLDTIHSNHSLSHRHYQSEISLYQAISAGSLCVATLATAFACYSYSTCM